MADGRMLKKKISKSRRLANLKSDSARLLYTWLIPHLDIEGRFSGDPSVIKGEVVPRLKQFTDKKVEECILDMARNELILLYTNDGDRFLQLRRFADEQSLRRDKEKESEIPPPDQCELLFPAGLPATSRPPPDEVKLREEKIREYIALTPDQLKELKKRFSEEQLEWMFDKLDYYLSTTKKKYSGAFGFFKKGSWLIEEMNKNFNLSPKDSGLCEKCGAKGKYIGGLCVDCYYGKGKE